MLAALSLSEFDVLALVFQGLQYTLIPSVAPCAGSSGSGVCQPHVVSTPASTSCTARMVNVDTDSTSVIDPVLAFIKAFHLKGLIKRAIKDHESVSV